MKIVKKIAREVCRPFKKIFDEMDGDLKKAKELKRDVDYKFHSKNKAIAAFCVTGGIGDQIIAARFIRDLKEKTGNFRYDIFSSRPAIASRLYAKDRFCDSIYDNIHLWELKKGDYAVAFNVFEVIRYDHSCVDYSRLYEYPELFNVCKHIEESLEKYRPYVDMELPYYNNVIANLAIFYGRNRYDLCHEIAGITPRSNVLDIDWSDGSFPDFLLNKKYITVQNGFDEAFKINGLTVNKSTKYYPHFDALVKLIKNNFPQLLIVQLGSGQNSTLLKNVDINLVGKTQLSDAALIIKESLLHLDIEGGLVHLAASLNVQSCVVFGPTPMEFFGYKENINLTSGECGDCWWRTRNWMVSCAKGFDEPICMWNLSPEFIFNRIKNSIENKIYSLSGDNSVCLQLNGEQREKIENSKCPKKPLCFFMGITDNIAFAAGNVALSLNKYLTDVDYDIVIYHGELDKKNKAALEKIPHVVLKKFELPEEFISKVLNKIPKNSRFRDMNRLMCFAHFEVFSQLEFYKTAVWLDADISIQKDISNIVYYRPIGMTSDDPWKVKDNFSKEVAGFDMEEHGFCTAIMVVQETIPWKKVRDWCYKKSIELADILINPDQGVINLALQEFKLKVDTMEYTEWQCVPWREQAHSAKIVHFGTEKKVWNSSDIFNSFPEWGRVHEEWVNLGGVDFDRSKITVANVYKP